MLQRSDYESLDTKPPIVLIGQNGITVDGQSFNIDGAIYVNLELRCIDGTNFTLPYETVLVCPDIKLNILGISAEKRFSSVLRDNKTMTLTLYDVWIGATSYRQVFQGDSDSEACLH